MTIGERRLQSNENLLGRKIYEPPDCRHWRTSGLGSISVPLPTLQKIIDTDMGGHVDADNEDD